VLSLVVFYFDVDHIRAALANVDVHMCSRTSSKMRTTKKFADASVDVGQGSPCGYIQDAGGAGRRTDGRTDGRTILVFR